MATERLDIFEVLRNINKKNYNYVQDLEDDQRKQFSPFVVNQWLCCSNSPLQIVLMDKLVNRRFFKLSRHPNLIYKLFCIAAVDKNARYNWLFKKAEKSDAIDIIAKYLDCSRRDASRYKDSFSQDDIKEMIVTLGYQPSEIKKLKV